MNKATTDNAKRFLAKGPTFLGTVLGVDFYEHPEFGDEAPCYVVTPSGKVLRSEWWELPEKWDFNPTDYQ